MGESGQKVQTSSHKISAGDITYLEMTMLKTTKETQM